MKKWTFGVDLGGTEIKFGLFDDSLNKHWSIPTNRQNQGAFILEDIAKEIKKKCDEYGIAMDELNGIGIGVPGPVLEDNVAVACGAKVLGNITMHSGSLAAAGAVVVKDVPENAIVGGIPAKVIGYKDENNLDFQG